MVVWSFLTGAGMLAVAVGSVAAWRYDRPRHATPREPKPTWPLFAWGALAWLAGGFFLKAIAAYPVLLVYGRWPAPVQWGAVGLLTGVFECGVALAIARAVPRLRSASWRAAVAFGVGFGAAEAAVTSLDAFFPAPPDAISAPYESAAPDVQTETFTEVAAPAFERLNAMFLHAYAAALVVYAVRTGRWRWFWLAFGYKTLADGLPIDRLAPFGLWAMEAAYVPLAVVGAWGLVALRRRWDRPPPAPRAVPNDEFGRPEGPSSGSSESGSGTMGRLADLVLPGA